MNKDHGSFDLPSTVSTGQGERMIGRFHLMVDGQEVDGLDVNE